MSRVVMGDESLDDRVKSTRSHEDLEGLSEDSGLPQADKIRLGICAMTNKVEGKEMKAILSHLEYTKRVEIIKFPESLLLDEPIENWPIVEALVAFNSRRYPLDKVIAYIDLTKPFLVNDVRKQKLLQDRRALYQALNSELKMTVDYEIYDREAEQGEGFEEFFNKLVIHGQVFDKPFVEKPFDADDHNICIYYGVEGNLGSTKLIRKTMDKCSELQNTSEVRRDKGYIYEKFLQTDGFDIKVYAVGPEYFHAEARRSPVLDGRVHRTPDGKEKRYPVILSSYEKDMAKKVVEIFGQFVCGLDILRSKGKSYVCDVNGWSFVKGNSKYYADCANLILDLLLRNLRPNEKRCRLAPLLYGALSQSSTPAQGEILRSVVCISRHGDRTPKQKLKFVTQDQDLCSLCGHTGRTVKLKRARDLQTILDTANTRLQEGGLGAYLLSKFKLIKAILEGHSFEGINRKVQIKPIQIEITPEGKRVKEARFILKWGGALTHRGIEQSYRIGETMRKNLYPGEEFFVRLHSTYFQDLKCYSADEGRCQTTAAAFLKGFLELENELLPIIVTMVHMDKYAVKILDSAMNAEPDILRMKSFIREQLNSHEPLLKLLQESVPQASIQAFTHITDTLQYLQSIFELLIQMKDSLKQLKRIDPHRECCEKELVFVMYKRWKKLLTLFYDPVLQTFDATKLSTMREFVRYDLIHNHDIVSCHWQQLHDKIDMLGQVTSNLEMAMTASDKWAVSKRIVNLLLKKINHDLIWWRNPNMDLSLIEFEEESYNPVSNLSTSKADDTKLLFPFMRTRLYFANFSHIQALFLLVKQAVEEGRLRGDFSALRQVVSMEYGSHIVFKLFERLNAEPADPLRFRFELYLCPGTHDLDHEAQSCTLVPICPDLTLKELHEFFLAALS